MTTNSPECSWITKANFQVTDARHQPRRSQSRALKKLDILVQR